MKRESRRARARARGSERARRCSVEAKLRRAATVDSDQESACRAACFVRRIFTRLMIWTTTRRVTRLSLERHCRAFSSLGPRGLVAAANASLRGLRAEAKPFSARPMSTNPKAAPWPPLPGPPREGPLAYFACGRAGRVSLVIAGAPCDLRPIYKYRNAPPSSGVRGSMNSRYFVRGECRAARTPGSMPPTLEEFRSTGLRW